MFDSEGDVHIDLSSQTFELKNPDLPIAILIGPYTVSAGEMLALAFKGMPNAVTFGHETNGLTTSLSHFYLSDGSLIFITDSVFVDPTGQVYGGPVQPDIVVESGYSDTQTIPPEALEWLSEQGQCPAP